MEIFLYTLKTKYIQIELAYWHTIVDTDHTVYVATQ